MSAAWRGSGAAFQRHAIPRLGAAFAAGAVLNLAFAPFGWWPVAVLAPAGLFGLIRGLPPRRAAWAGAAFGAGLFACGTYWLYTSLHGYGGVPVWLTVVLQTSLVAIMAAYPAALCYLANRFWLKPGITRDWLALPALWVLLEWLRGWVLTGFPWLSLGYAVIDSPLAGWAPVLGVYGVSWAAALAAVAVNILFARPVRPSGVAVAGGVLAALFLLPFSLSQHAWTRAVDGPIPIAAVQGNVPQDQKWQRNNLDATLARYANLTTQAWGARLIVWPESALPVLATDIPEYLHRLAETVRAHDADLALGLVTYKPETHQYFNGLLVMSGSGGGWYYKRHLVPFGEYFPVPAFVRSWMRLMSLPYDDISAGAPRQPTLRAAGQALGLTICYEDAFGSKQLAVLKEATLLLNVTNDAWFGDSTASHQHLQIARMRALEAGRYMIVAANDGITAVIDAGGTVAARLPQFRQAVLRAEVQPMTGLTPYARWGNLPVVQGALVLLVVGVWRRRRID